MPALPTAAIVAPALDIRTRAAEDARYPCSDGRPMSDNMWQWRAIQNAAGDIGVARPEALVAADILVYPEQGNPRNRVAPDVLAAFGLGSHNRMTYLVWKEGKPPDWVLEVASPGTAANDLGFKRRAYAAMGVPEYWLFDPQGNVFPGAVPRLQGLKLVGAHYEPLEPRLEGDRRTIRSTVLGLDLRVEGELIRFRDPSIGKDIPHHAEFVAIAERAAAREREEAARRKAAEAHAEREAAGRKAAQTQVAELTAALRRLRASSSDAPS